MWTEAEWGGSQNSKGAIPTPGLIDFYDTDRIANDLNGTGYARRDSAEHFSRLDALHFTAMAWIFIPAYCFAIP